MKKEIDTNQIRSRYFKINNKLLKSHRQFLKSYNNLIEILNKEIDSAQKWISNHSLNDINEKEVSKRFGKIINFKETIIKFRDKTKEATDELVKSWPDS